MKKIYTIRDTINQPALANQIALLVQQQLPEVTVLIVTPEPRDSSHPFPVISLDPFSRINSDFTLDICRVFKLDKQEKAHSFTQRPGHATIQEQLQLIPDGEYTLIDDDICTGGTVNYIKKTIQQNHRNIIISQTISLVHQTLQHKLNEPFELYDTIDTHDFVQTTPYSGLLIEHSGELKRYLYTHPFVNLETRAKLINPLQFKVSLLNFNKN